MLGFFAVAESPLSTGLGAPAPPVIPPDQVVIQATRLFCPILEDMLPDVMWRDDTSGDLRKLVTEVFQPVLDLLCEEAQRWVDQNDVDLADEKTVDAMLRDLGNPFAIAFSQSLNRKRLLVRNLVAIYKAKGTAPGLENVIRALTGIEVVQVISPATFKGWILGVDVLSDTPFDPPPEDPEVTDLAFLGPSEGFVRYSFQVEVDRVLTDDEKEIVTEIIKLVKPVHTHFVGFIEPDTAPAPDHWELGLSLLEDESVLH